jgi:hypothetical protein
VNTPVVAPPIRNLALPTLFGIVAAYLACGCKPVPHVALYAIQEANTPRFELLEGQAGIGDVRNFVNDTVFVVPDNEIRKFVFYAVNSGRVCAQADYPEAFGSVTSLAVRNGIAVTTTLPKGQPSPNRSYYTLYTFQLSMGRVSNVVNLSAQVAEIRLDSTLPREKWLTLPGSPYPVFTSDSTAVIPVTSYAYRPGEAGYEANPPPQFAVLNLARPEGLSYSYLPIRYPATPVGLCRPEGHEGWALAWNDKEQRLLLSPNCSSLVYAYNPATQHVAPVGAMASGVFADVPPGACEQGLPPVTSAVSSYFGNLVWLPDHQVYIRSYEIANRDFPPRCPRAELRYGFAVFDRQLRRCGEGALPPNLRLAPDYLPGRGLVFIDVESYKPIFANCLPTSQGFTAPAFQALLDSLYACEPRGGIPQLTQQLFPGLALSESYCVVTVGYNTTCPACFSALVRIVQDSLGPQHGGAKCLVVVTDLPAGEAKRVKRRFEDNPNVWVGSSRALAGFHSLQGGVRLFGVANAATVPLGTFAQDNLATLPAQVRRFVNTPPGQQR